MTKTQKVLKQIINEIKWQEDRYRGTENFRIYRCGLEDAIQIIEKYYET